MSLKEKVDHAYFTRRMFLGAVLPAPLAGIGLALAEMGHTILVGHAIGTEGLAAVGFASPLFLLAAFFVFGLSMGGAVIYANLMNEGKKEEALSILQRMGKPTSWPKAISLTSCWGFPLRFSWRW